jgi:hypothetical protein
VTGSPRLDYRINFVRTGVHYVWIRGAGATGSDDSVHVGLDGQAVTTADRVTGFGPAFGWTNATMDGVVATINVTTPGIHTLNLWMREDGTVVDRVVLTTNPAFNPGAAGLQTLRAVEPPAPPAPPATPGNGVLLSLLERLEDLLRRLLRRLR